MHSVPGRTANTGLLILMAGAAVDSTSGLFSRLLSTDGFTTASGRGLFAFVFMLALLVWRDRGRAAASLLGIGGWGLALCLLNAGGMVMSILSLKFTAVANFFMIFAAAPFAAAIAARAVLGERLDMATLLAAAAGFAGIAIMMLSGSQAGGLAGNLLACCCVLTYSAIVLVLRRNPSIDMLPVLTVTMLVSGLIALPFAEFSNASATEFGVLALFGLIQLAGGNLLIFKAIKMIPAAQAGMLGILNATFAPVWVFAVLGEVPPVATLIGGGVVLLAATAHLTWMLTAPRRQSFATA